MSGFDDVKKVFFTECAELLSDMEERLMQLEDGAHDAEQLNAIFRCAHSIKGGAGAFGFDGIMHFTHVTEALLDEMREGRIVPTHDTTDILLKAVDVVTTMLKTAEAGGNPPADAGAQLMAEMKSCMAGGSQSAAVQSTVPAATNAAVAGNDETAVYDITFKPHADFFKSGNEPLLLLRELSQLGKVELFLDDGGVPDIAELDPGMCYLSWSVFVTTRSSLHEIQEVFEFAEPYADLKFERVGATGVPVAAVTEIKAEDAQKEGAAVAAEVQAQAQGSRGSSSIRVDLDKIDRLVNMVGELVITEAMLRAQTRDLPMEKYVDLQRGIDELSHHTRELQEAVMAVRMQPVKSIFSRMPRIVRDTATKLEKDIQLVMSGENTEVDKTVIEQLGDPLTHMIRNSVDHGIESPEKRRQLGKPETGTIHLSAYHCSGQIIIEISDDGAGINRARVLSKAREKGLVAADAILGDEEIDHIIFMPGFSTAEQVTAVSGRGVGMDVVRRNIESIGGTVKISNTPGEGSVFTIALPLTLAILDGMIVRVGSEYYIVPITSIIETMRPGRKDIHHVQGRGDVINVRGEFVPLVYLHDVFNVSDAEQSADKALVVLVETGNGNSRMGLVVDELVGQQQVVIKSLQENTGMVKGISGATILGDGKVSLILEINELKPAAETAKRIVSAA